MSGDPVADERGVGRRRLGARRLVAIGLGTWLIAALLPLGWLLPPALRAGTVNRRLHGQFTALGSGWTGTVEHTSKPGAKGPDAWEWSFGPTSTIGIAPGWRAVSLQLSPIHCPDGQPQRVVIHGPGATRTIVLSAGYHWYQIGVGRVDGARTLTLTYRCVVVPASLHNGDSDARPLAVQIAGLVGST